MKYPPDGSGMLRSSFQGNCFGLRMLSFFYRTACERSNLSMHVFCDMYSADVFFTNLAALTLQLCYVGAAGTIVNK